MKRDNVVLILVLALFLCLTSICPAFADALWPAMISTIGLLSWGPILAGLLIEWLVVRRITGFAWGKSLLADFLMNLASTLLGLVLIPVFGLLLIDLAFMTIMDSSSRPVYAGGVPQPLMPEIIYSSLFSVLAALVNCAIEALVLSRLFKVPMTRKRLWMLYFANLASVFIASAYFLLQVLERTTVVSP